MLAVALRQAFVSECFQAWPDAPCGPRAVLESEVACEGGEDDAWLVGLAGVALGA